MNELALFAGGGGGLLGSELIGLTPRCAVEIDPYARKILLARQRDGMLPTFPIWDDVETFDGRPWRGSIDVITGGWPCQDISGANPHGKGLSGTRSGLFFEMLRIIEEVRPRIIFAENSPNLRTKGLAVVLQEFTALGYSVRWCVLGAWHIGAPHKRDRMWIYGELANPHSSGLKKQRGTGANEKKFIAAKRGGPRLADSVSVGLQMEVFNAGKRPKEKRSGGICIFGSGGLPKKGYQGWRVEPKLGRVVNGVADRVDRLKAIGNGQVPAVACLAWKILSGGVLENGS